jgi:AraC-like DNA-binding protein
MQPPRDTSTVVRAAGWTIALPAASARLHGVRMAGFTAASAGPVELGVVPYPALTLALDLGGELAVETADGAVTRGGLVVGVAPRGLRGRGRAVECLQVRLSPLLAHAVVPGAAELAGSAATLEDVLGPAAVRLEQRLRETPTWSERFELVTAALVGLRGSARPPDPEVAAAWRRIVGRGGAVRVSALADELGWSRTRLWSRFRSQLGLTPKRAAELVRFDLASHGLAAGRRAAVVAADLGYADQSHLHRAARAFAAMTPTRVAGAAWLAVDDVAWPGAREHSSKPAGAARPDRGGHD